MNVNVILKPAPHCPIPYGHPLYRGFIPSEHTNIRQTWRRSAYLKRLDDYDLTDALGHLETMGAFK